MASGCVGAAACALTLALLIPATPWAAQRLFWHMNQPPAGQVKHVAKFPPDVRDNLVRGVPTNSFNTDRRMDFLEQNFTHLPGDVWVVTYQKVGTTWVQYIVSLLQGNPRETSALDLMTKRCPWPEVDVGLLSTPASVLQQSSAPRCFKSHWPRRGFFAGLPETSKVINVVRDAESVAVSYWHHMFNLFGVYWLKDGDMTWDQYFEKWYHGDLQNGDYFEHVASWWEVRGKANVLILRFEDLVADTAGAIGRIAAFINAPLDELRLAEILEATSRASMRKWNDGLADRLLIALGIMKGEHVRKAGSSSEVSCSHAQRARLVDKYEAVLKPLGMPFEYMFAKGQGA